MSLPPQSDWFSRTFCLEDGRAFGWGTDIKKAVDAVSRLPDRQDARDSLLKVSDSVGPWRISRTEEDNFTWRVTESTSVTDRIKYDVRPHQTRRARETSLRLLLIGESAAGSWGFFGENRLSTLLASTLSSHSEGGCEVIDLSCVNANWRRDCLQSLSAGITLAPDAVIVFAGNNEARWLVPSLTQDDLPQVGGAFEARWEFLTGNTLQAMELLSSVYTSALRRCVADTMFICRSFQIPVIFVLPPQNGRTWLPPETLPAHLTTDKLAHWWKVATAAERALSDGDMTRARHLSESALELDGGKCQRSHWLLAKSAEVDNPAFAVEQFALATMSGLGPFLQAVPGLPRHGADAIRRTAEALRAEVVDLASVFAVADEGDEDQEPLFLDYCHLSARGHELAVQQIAATCRKVGLIPAHDHEDIQVEWSAPAKKQHEIALAALCAGLHAHQNGQFKQTTRGWMRRALEGSPILRDLFCFLRDVVCTFRREWITLTHLRSVGIDDSVLPERFAIFVLKFIYHARYDIELFEILSSVLEDDAETRSASLGSQTDLLLEALEGNLCRLFFLDLRKGFGMTQREMSRRGWEERGRQFVADAPVGTVYVPGCLHPPECIRLRISPPTSGTVVSGAVALNGRSLGKLCVAENQGEVELETLPESWKAETNTFTFEWDCLYGPEDIASEAERATYVSQFGRYPVAAIVHEMRLLNGAAHWI